MDDQMQRREREVVEGIRGERVKTKGNLKYCMEIQYRSFLKHLHI